MNYHRSILLAAMIVLAACGKPEPAEAPRTPAQAQSSRDAMLNERLSAIQNRITELDHRISESAVASRQLNEEMTALRQELAAGAVRPAGAPATAATPQTIAPAPAQPAPIAPAVPITPAQAPAAEAPSSHNPIVWIIILAILAVAIWFIVKLLMGPWSESEEESDWIEEGAAGENEEEINLAPEAGAEGAEENKEENKE